MPSIPAGIAPHFLVEDVVGAAEYYRDRLGFAIGPYFFEPPAFVVVQRDGMSIQLSRMIGKRGGSNAKWKADAFDAYVRVKDIDALHAEFAAKHADILAPPRLKPFGMKEMDVRDADGYVLRWGAEIPRAPTR